MYSKGLTNCSFKVNAPFALEVVPSASGLHLTLRGANDLLPQSLCFALSKSNDLDKLQAYLEELQPLRCEVFDPTAMPSALAEIFERSNVALDVWVVDGSWIHSAFASLETRRVLATARSIFVPCMVAHDFAKRNLLGHTLPLRVTPIDYPIVTFRPPDKSDDRRTLAIVPARSSPKEFSVVRTLASRLCTEAPTVRILVIGSASSMIFV